MNQPKYSQVRVKLVGEDGNAFAIINRVRLAMRLAGLSQEEITIAIEEMTSGDYNHLLKTVMNLVSVDGEKDEEEDLL